MPFDYNEFSQGISKAREAKVSDDDILSHLASLDQGFKDAKENGYSLNDIDSFLKEKYKTKGGDNNNAYQTSQDQQGSSGDRNAQDGQASQVEAGSSDGVQANVQPSSQDQQILQRGQQTDLNITTALTGDSKLGIGGEPLERQEQMSVGSGYKGPQAEVQQAIPSEGKAGEQAEVALKPAPFPAVRSQGEVGAGEAFGRSLMEGVAKTNDLIVEGLGVFPYLEDKTMKMFGVDSDLYGKWKKAASDAGIASPEAYAIKQNEQLTTGGKITQQFGSFAADILPMIATGGIGAEVKGMQLASSETMGILDALKASLPKIRESVQAMAIPALKAGSEAAKQSAESGDSALKQTAKGIASAATTAITGAIPMSAESKVANPILRFMQQGALGFLTGIPIAEQQKVVDAWISGKPYVPSSFKDMALQAIPMALITGTFGVLHEPAKKITSDMYRDLEDLSLTETAKVLKEQEQNPLPQPKTFISKENLLAKGQKRYTELSAKRDSGEVLSPEEAKEFEVLQKVPTTEELAEHYGHEIQEPKKKPATAKAEAQPEKPSEKQVQETSGVSTEQGKPVVEAPAVEAEKGTPQREVEGKKEVKVPDSLAEATTVEEVDAWLKNRKRLNEIHRKNPEARGKADKGHAMQAAARKRQITGNLTAKEKAAQQKREASNYVGKQVSVDGQNGVIIGNPFGRVKIRFEDKSESTHLPEKIEPPIKVEEEVKPSEAEKPKEITSFSEASTPEEVDEFLAQSEEDAKTITQTKQKNSFLNQARKQAIARRKEIKAEATKKTKEEATKPKPSKEPVMEAPAPEPEPIPEEAPKEQGEPKARKPREKKPSEPMGTRVLSAAFRPNKGKNKGKVFYGASHVQAMLKSGMSWMEIQKDYSHPEQREGLEFGYKTDTKPFVSRDKGEQVARLSGQANLKKLDADKALGYKMHSNHLALDDHPETLKNLTDLPIAAGAMNIAEKGLPFSEKDHNADLVKSAQIHKDLSKGEFKGGTNYSAWSKAFEKAFPDFKNYSEDERFNLFKDGESLAAHSEFFKKEPEQAVKFPKMWSGKTTEEIKNESTDRSTQDIRFTNDSIDEDRMARRLEPIMKQAKIASGEHWEEAMEQINSREGYAAAFINSLKKNVRVLSPVETSILRHSVAESMAKRDSVAQKLYRETDPRLIKRYDKEYSDAQRDYAELSELYSRSNSEAGRALGFLRMLVKADYSLFSLITKARAGKRRGGKGDAELTKEERDGLAKISEDIEKAEKDFVDSLEAQKLKENKLGLIQYLEFSSKLISTLEGEKSDAKSELNRFTTMLKNSRQDAISMGLAVRGMARNLSILLKTKNEDKILDAVHDRISNIMGDTWGKDQTLDILNGNGVYFHTTEEGIKTPLKIVKDRSDAFNKQFANALKKSPAKREFILSKMLEKFSIEVHNLEAQINGHLEDVAIDADRIIGELDNDLLSCE